MKPYGIYRYKQPITKVRRRRLAKRAKRHGAIAWFVTMLEKEQP